jgi:NAD(P)-dependent dehydrogenase (short-subunit alcohol dehydrogenase family)
MPVDAQRVAVITGASSGIGESLARLLATRGRHCVLLARREDRLRALAEELGGEYELCDVADRHSVEHAAAAIRERHPQIGLLVNNAGVAGRIGFLDGAPEQIENVLRTNYLGNVWVLRAFLPSLAAGSDVVNVVSIAGEVAARSGPYAASKHAQLAFSRVASIELAERGIRVHTIKPGFVETEGFPQRWLPRPAQRFVIGPRDVAEHIISSLERGSGETTVPRYYRVAAILQGVAPNLLARLVISRGSRSRIAR